MIDASGTRLLGHGQVRADRLTLDLADISGRFVLLLIDDDGNVERYLGALTPDARLVLQLADGVQVGISDFFAKRGIELLFGGPGAARTPQPDDDPAGPAVDDEGDDGDDDGHGENGDRDTDGDYGDTDGQDDDSEDDRPSDGEDEGDPDEQDDAADADESGDDEQDDETGDDDQDESDDPEDDGDQGETGEVWTGAAAASVGSPPTSVGPWQATAPGPAAPSPLGLATA
ncbi:MAG: hypothetical protein KIT12_01545 [Trueperaceae bacterium]|nr:hypothetical protein [Trueperaceae bacterium]